MITEFIRKIKKITTSKKRVLDPDEIFLDSSNLPEYDKDQFEGRIEKPIADKNMYIVIVIFLIIVLSFFYKIINLQLKDGSKYAEKSLNNHLRHDTIFTNRGTITDRNNIPLAWSEINTEDIFPKRKYIETGGFGNLLGFIKYPQRDSSGIFSTITTIGKDGIEKYFNSDLVGENGVKLTEVDVKGNIESQSTVLPPKNGKTVELSIDSRLQEKMFSAIKTAVIGSDFIGGAGIFMDSHTGEIISLVTYPEYNSSLITEGNDSKAITETFSNKNNPFLDRGVSGLYAPGSIVKPFIGIGVLNENIIDPYQNILSTGSISLPNPYDKEHPSIFKDWKAHGYVDLRRAIAVSSDVYFYEVGGGFENQKGLGIQKIDDYLQKFLFTTPTEDFFSGPAGIIPSPEWKKKNFNGDDWRVGDTYHTTIGQYGFQVTPLQVVRAMTGLANAGTVVSPVILKDEQGKINKVENIPKNIYTPIQEGMRLAVTDGTAKPLNIPGIEVAAKTGTAELGSGKQYVNSWIAGFLPYKDPKYVFAIVLEKGPVSHEISAMNAMASVLSWAKDNAPEYVDGVKAVLSENK